MSTSVRHHSVAAALTLPLLTVVPASNPVSAQAPTVAAQPQSTARDRRIALEGAANFRDLGGYAGFADEVDNHWFRIITGVALGTLVSATAQRSQGDVSGFNPTIPQLWASNAGGAINQAGQQITQKNLAIQPTIKVRPGFTVNVLVTKDVVLVPYKR